MKSLPIAASRTPSDVALLHADGALPNLALMRLATYFRERGAAVRLVRPGERRSTLFGDRPTCFGSSIFQFSATARARLEREWAPIVWGGTGVRVESSLAEVDAAVDWDAVAPDYLLYPAFKASLGFTQRGCRLSCKFCVVPRKEGRPRAVGSVESIWRGAGHPKHLILLDNDFFGQPREEWRARLDEIRSGGFKVALSQGINVRQVDAEAAEALASIEYRDNEFRERVLYTAWDNLGDEEVFRRGVAILQAAGIPPTHLRVYMLIGFAPRETWADIWSRYSALRDLGCEPYPMVFDPARRPEGLTDGRTLKDFQRWALRLARSGKIPWESYDPHVRAARAAERRSS